MKLRPTIFLSGVSSEFGSFRDAVEVEVQKKGCFAENQSSFGVDYHTVEEMLRRRISDADAVIHIVGFRFGAEPKDRPADKPRRSYTQMEYDIARELQKPIFLFLSTDATIADAVGTDEAEAPALQLAHRQAIQDSNPLFYFFKDKAELCKLAGEIEPVAQTDFRVDTSRIDKYAPAELIGREDELALLNDVWLKVRRAESKRPHILTFVALGGEGKTSLVAKWLADLAYQNWPGCDSAFAWSFYSQGSHEQSAASSDLFLKEAIIFFGDDADAEFAGSAAGAYEKGQRLARIVGQRRSLLILDGVEPLQYSPTSPTLSELKDAGLIALLRGLAARSDGLCIVTTRYSIPNLKAYWQTTVPEVELLRLSRQAGVHLLKTLGVWGTDHEIETLVQDVKGHALTLNLLGTYLRDAHGGDIRRRHLIKLEEADAEEQGGHAFRVMTTYEHAFEAEGEKGERALAVLRLLGLFDRPMTVDCLAVLLQQPAIAGLTEPLVALSEPQRNIAFKRLEDAKLITVNREQSGVLVSLDGHPMLREYFAQQLRTDKPDAWRGAHRRLYEYLCATTQDKNQPTLEDLQRLYQAVAHGCKAGLSQQAFDSVYVKRIVRTNQYYSLRKLNAYGADLGAVTSFFEVPWSVVSSNLSNSARAILPDLAGSYLRALGRLGDAIEPTRLSLTMYHTHQKWTHAAISANNLSEIESTLGQLHESLEDAKRSVTYADRSGDMFQRAVSQATRGDCLHNSGLRTEAENCFREAQEIQKASQPSFPILYSLRGFQYCDLLLTKAECSAWNGMLERHDSTTHSSVLSVLKTTQRRTKLPQQRKNYKSRYAETLRFVARRAMQTLNWATDIPSAQELDLALDHLTLGRVQLYAELLCPWTWLMDKNSSLDAVLDAAVRRIRKAGRQDYLTLGLLTRAWFRFLTGECNGSSSAQEDLDEAWEIAERGPMRLQMADIHLYRARLFFREKEYPWKSAEADLKEARRLIEKCGYWRRKEELEDAERVILKKSA